MVGDILSQSLWTIPRTVRHGAHDQIFQALSPFFYMGRSLGTKLAVTVNYNWQKLWVPHLAFIMKKERWKMECMKTAVRTSKEHHAIHSVHVHVWWGRDVAIPRFPPRNKKTGWLGTEDEATFKCATTTVLQVL